MATMAPKPYLREADDGTFELLVPAGFGRVHVLPYCFHTEEDAARWITSRKGRERLMSLGGQIDHVVARPSFRSIEQSLT
ncbi:hypothetical protein T281_10375 [Rhodomicrobium udaipurense JA643]|uniref:Uncharacterized protein n=1 Tax=Rhodomicrobium udaipurense TaxID=1202716 RepID=A0A8I1GHQ3_9HYPH|nr:hypothetical protein [Rhodomicrobium udaipurense]KAI94552.1 hypothetical protein T281_10375 [Rhodomicrobium udaipurense JA643]MBJ7544386.1 hypothetical protein [Rhodomicrobium udaipurense]